MKAPLVIIKALGLDVKVESIRNNPEFEKLFPFKRVPSFVAPDGYRVNEAVAVIYYRMSLTTQTSITDLTV